jgi:hypothetical protein
MAHSDLTSLSVLVISIIPWLVFFAPLFKEKASNLPAHIHHIL